METSDNREAPIRVHFGSGLHAAAGRPVDASAYEQYLGRWSRLFVPAVLAAAEVASGDRVLDIATGPGEAALLALSKVTPTGRIGNSKALLRRQAPQRPPLARPGARRSAAPRGLDTRRRMGEGRAAGGATGRRPRDRATRETNHPGFARTDTSPQGGQMGHTRALRFSRTACG
jgi:hypothetical protein